jgi:predicted flavoprotein YhiN
LMAAETIAAAGLPVTVYERKPNPGRKFLLAGRGGLNLTHSEDIESFIARYGSAAKRLRPAIEKFPPSALRAWCEGLGQPTFVGSSGRVFPKSFKASPLLRVWRARLEKLGVKFEFHRKWTGWGDDGALLFVNAHDQTEKIKADATVLALGGASWPRLGADGGCNSISLSRRCALRIAGLKWHGRKYSARVSRASRSSPSRFLSQIKPFRAR